MSLTNPTVFLSYAWSTPEHQDWVINLANRLIESGVDVRADFWYLKPGHDKYHFMESMVNSKEIDKVLVIADKIYAQKANKRKGGVGTEAIIMTPEIYRNVVQEKFIAIVKELRENEEPYLPTFLATRIYFDLSDDDRYESNFPELLRFLHGRPSLRKPVLGKPPAFLNDESDSDQQARKSSELINFRVQAKKIPAKINAHLRIFLGSYYERLQTLKLSHPSNDSLELGNQILTNLDLYFPLRNEYIEVLEVLFGEALDFDVDVLIKFLEKLPLLLVPWDPEVKNFRTSHFGNYKFIIHELFLYTVTVGLKHENYTFLEEILGAGYFYKDILLYDNAPQKFTCFCTMCEEMEAAYNVMKGVNKSSPDADLMLDRLPDGISKNQVIEADLICYYISRHFKKNYSSWLPMTYVYAAKSLGDTLNFFSRLVSRKHIEKVSGLLGINDLLELRKKLAEIDGERREMPFRNNGAYIPALSHYIDATLVGTVR
jgi:hypothetical protein